MRFPIDSWLMSICVSVLCVYGMIGSVALMPICVCLFRGQLHQQCCEEWTLVSEETQAKMARMAAAAAWGLGKITSP